MWIRLVGILRCPVCRSQLNLSAFKEVKATVSDEHLGLAKALGIATVDLTRWVETGLLVCEPCRVWYPIWQGLPVLLPYQTSFHHQFRHNFRAELSHFVAYSPAQQQPKSGEEFVLRSFSKEWNEYHYDGVIWEMSYNDHARRFSQEVSSFPEHASLFLEVGCGLGITTSLAQQRFACDAIGADLSFAALKASNHFNNNPFLHFVQASAFSLPFAHKSFDLIYSRGVLHHTYSTENAVKTVAQHCREHGHFYVWLYGPGSIDSTTLRRFGYQIERLLRPVIARKPNAWFSRLFLHIMALPYLGYNSLRRLNDPAIQKYNFERALHAARDRFTPLYAHRQSAEEVANWFRDAGFAAIAIVDWRTMPSADHDDYRRNVGMAGARASTTQGHAIAADAKSHLC